MYLVVGLGNPEEEYENTRHNVGFAVLDDLVKRYPFRTLSHNNKFSALISKNLFHREQILLAKPQTFMNDSGNTVKALVQFYKDQNPKLIVIHDDIDIPLGEMKVSENRGSAGHKGVDSIIQTLGTKNFTRIRIGIRPLKGKPKNVESFVLKPFQKTELPLLQSAIRQTTESLSSLTSLRNS